MTTLSTPSLGITRLLNDGYIKETKAFNSLSRDHVYRYRVLAERFGEAFNSLSRDHFTRSVHGTLTSELSTPSLGITEPDSGIFRLSAAFCRGTSSHK